MTIRLKGTTWAHLRGLAPLAAASQAFADRQPGVEIQWETHSARRFGEGPLEELAQHFDLACFDHPLTGQAADQGLFLVLDEHLAPEYLDPAEPGCPGDTGACGTF